MLPGELLVAIDVVLVDILQVQRVVLVDDRAARVAVDSVATTVSPRRVNAVVTLLPSACLVSTIWPSIVVPPAVPPRGPSLPVSTSVWVEVAEVDVVGSDKRRALRRQPGPSR